MTSLIVKDGVDRHQSKNDKTCCFLKNWNYGIFIFNIIPGLTEFKSYTWYRMLIKDSIIAIICHVWFCFEFSYSVVRSCS